MKKTDSKPPKHLSTSTRKWWESIAEQYVLEDHHLLLLQGACEEWDRVQQARRQVKKDGAYPPDRFGQVRAHPALDVERKARNAFRLLLRELGLDIEPLVEHRMAGRSHLRLAR